MTLTLAGPKAWTIREVIGLCENFSEGNKAKVTQVPNWIIRTTRSLLSSNQWAKDASDRLAFTEVVQGTAKITKQMDTTYQLLDLDPSQTLTLEQYLKDYYSQIIKKLNEFGSESRQTDFLI